jgi:hypothetical protein
MDGERRTVDGMEERINLVKLINGSLAEMELARARVNKAKSEMGCAGAELTKAEEKYESLCARLQRTLPVVR